MPRSIFNGAGYYLSDNSASGGQKVEDNILGCRHCQKLLRKSDLATYGYCRTCDSVICAHCHRVMLTEGCTPFAKLVDRQLADTYRRQQNAKILGL